MTTPPSSVPASALPSSYPSSQSSTPSQSWPLQENKQLPPAQPAYVLRGHAAPIHAVQFARSNARLISADADGWVILWDTAVKRPTAVWRAHESAILGVADWGPDRVITHGKDDKLCVWQVDPIAELHASKVLPAEDPSSHRQQPWLLHVLPVNTLNFCAFSRCLQPGWAIARTEVVSIDGPSPVLVAVPSVLDSNGIDIFQLPSETRIYTIVADKSINTGMVMALGLYPYPERLILIAGFESGHTAIYQLNHSAKAWHRIYLNATHTQPVLSHDIHPSLPLYLTSSADSLIAKHPVPSPSSIPLPSSTSSLSPHKILQTKHAGQQGLRVRSDGKIFATAGWDGRVRVYAVKGAMRELATLKWHKEGCYAVAFAQILDSDDSSASEEGTTKDVAEDSAAIISAAFAEHGPRKEVILPDMSIQRRREQLARETHWLAAGSKDGKISLWDIY